MGIFADETILDGTKKRMTEKNHFQTQKKCSFMYEQIERNLQAMQRLEAIVQNPAEVLRKSLISKVTAIDLSDENKYLLDVKQTEQMTGNHHLSKEIETSAHKTVKAIAEYIIDASKT